jgi:hypothetical protein
MCMEMAAEGALGLSLNLGTCSVNPPFSAIMEGKESREVCPAPPPPLSPGQVDNNFFIAPVPIEFRQSTEFVSTFPRINRLVTSLSSLLRASPPLNRLPAVTEMVLRPLRHRTSSNNSLVRARKAGPC